MFCRILRPEANADGNAPPLMPPTPADVAPDTLSHHRRENPTTALALIGTGLFGDEVKACGLE
ncbi:MAG TPA: hypothetical protein DIW24_07615 [Bacteroidetes bacterium]|nr:hypothetical protein [Bacteroidota bacterium]